MSSPGQSGSRSAQRDQRDLRRDEHDSTVTGRLPVVPGGADGRGGPGEPDTGEIAHRSGDASGPYPASVMPGPSAPSGQSGASAYSPAATSPAPASARTEIVPPVPPLPPAGASSFASAPGGLPPRPGEKPTGGAPAAGGRSPLRRPGRVPRPARRAQLTLRRFNVWSVFKFSCMLAIALWLVWMISIGVLYGVIDAAGVVSKINDAVTTINGANSNPPIQAGQVLGIAAIVGVVNIVLFIALSSLFAVIYNLVADFVGGVEVTLSERE